METFEGGSRDFLREGFVNTAGRRFGAAQTMHSHKCDHVKFLLAHSQKNGRNFGHSLELFLTTVSYVRLYRVNVLFWDHIHM